MARRRSDSGRPKQRARSASHLKFRTRWRHVLHIDQRIRSGQAPNCKQLADDLEVSRRTVLRDIDFMRYDLGAPIKYDRAKGGYVYTEPSWSMPSVHMTEGELFALMVAESAMEACRDTPWASRLQSVLDRIILSLPDRVEVAPRDLLPRVSFAPNAPSCTDPEVLETLSRALAQNRTVRFRYRSLRRGDKRDFTVDPYVLRRARGAWYLVGRDHGSGYVPMFNVSRIEEVKLTERTFDYRATGFDPKEYFKSTFAVYETARNYSVAVEFSGVAAQLVREREWHPSQKLTDLPDGRLRFEVEVNHLDDIWPWVLSWGCEAKVMAPPELVELVARHGHAIARLYSEQRPQV